MPAVRIPNAPVEVLLVDEDNDIHFVTKPSASGYFSSWDCTVEIREKLWIEGEILWRVGGLSEAPVAGRRAALGDNQSDDDRRCSTWSSRRRSRSAVNMTSAARVGSSN